MNELNKFLNGLTKEEFLEKFWNKKPMLIKAAYPKACELAQRSDLIDFASDEDFESRIIYEDQKNYQVKDGPITNEDLKGKYTIACHALNLFSDEFKELEMLVSEIAPHWQFDDVMATVSQKGASVGAHTDHYGVFILQGSGKREWFIQENPNQEFIADLDVKILKEFKADYSWVLEPGDMIYVPPLCAHHGVTIEDSTSYSLGFKAFEANNIVKDYLFDLGDNYNDESFYNHNSLSNKYELNDEFVDFFHEKLMATANNKDLFKSWLASTLSSPRYPQLDENEFEGEISEYEIAMDLKFIHYKSDSTNYVYLNGHHKELNDIELESLISILDNRKISSNIPKSLQSFIVNSGAALLR
jgi:50S ribosomal protein L16 3-hydroxylase